MYTMKIRFLAIVCVFFGFSAQLLGMEDMARTWVINPLFNGLRVNKGNDVECENIKKRFRSMLVDNWDQIGQKGNPAVSDLFKNLLEEMRNDPDLSDHISGLLDGSICSKIIEDDWQNLFEFAHQNNLIDINKVLSSSCPLRPIEFAVLDSKNLIFQYLAEKLENDLCNMRTLGGTESTLLHLAAEGGNDEAFFLLRDTYGLSVDAKNNNGETPEDLQRASNSFNGSLIKQLKLLKEKVKNKGGSDTVVKHRTSIIDTAINIIRSCKENENIDIQTLQTKARSNARSLLSLVALCNEPKLFFQLIALGICEQTNNDFKDDIVGDLKEAYDDYSSEDKNFDINWKQYEPWQQYKQQKENKKKQKSQPQIINNHNNNETNTQNNQKNNVKAQTSSQNNKSNENKKSLLEQIEEIDNLVDARIKTISSLQDEHDIVKTVCQDKIQSMMENHNWFNNKNHDITNLEFFLNYLRKNSKYFKRHENGIFNGGLCYKIMDNDWLNAFKYMVDNNLVTLDHDVLENLRDRTSTTTPIQYAILYKKHLIFNYLAEKQKDELATIKTENGDTLLHLAVHSKNNEAFKTLKNKYKLDVNVKNNDNKTPSDLLTAPLSPDNASSQTTPAPSNSIGSNIQTFLSNISTDILPLSCYAGICICLYLYLRPAAEPTSEEIDNKVSVKVA